MLMAGRLPPGFLPGTLAASLRAMPTWQRRLIAAVLVSMILHAAVLLGLRAGSAGNMGSAGNQSAQPVVLVAHLAGENSPGTESQIAEASPTAALNPAPAGLPLREPAGVSLPAITAPPANASPGRPGAGALPLDLLRVREYYLASRLHKAPVALEPFRFDYPAESTVRDGRVVARILINERGGVDDVIIDLAEPPGTFEANTVASLLRARFSPGELHYQPVRSQIAVEVRYQNPEGVPGGMTVTATGP